MPTSYAAAGRRSRRRRGRRAATIRSRCSPVGAVGEHDARRRTRRPAAAARPGPPAAPRSRSCGPGRRRGDRRASSAGTRPRPSLVTSSSVRRRRRRARRGRRRRAGARRPTAAADSGVVRVDDPRPRWSTGSRSRSRPGRRCGWLGVRARSARRAPRARTTSSAGSVPSRCRQTWSGPVRLVVDGVEEPLRVGAPGAAVVAAGHAVGQVLAGAQVAEAQLEDLVAGGVDAVGEQVLVRADERQAEVEVAGPAILRPRCRKSAMTIRIQSLTLRLNRDSVAAVRRSRCSRGGGSSR